MSERVDSIRIIITIVNISAIISVSGSNSKLFSFSRFIRLHASMFTSICGNLVIAHFFVGYNLKDRQNTEKYWKKSHINFLTGPIFCFVVDPVNFWVQGSYSIISETALYRGTLY